MTGRHAKPLIGWPAALSVIAVCILLLTGLLALTSSNQPIVRLVTPSTCSAPAGVLTITICGNKWVNGSGQEVVLRGANTDGTQYDCAQSGAGFFDDPTVSGTDFSTEIAAMKAWGINIVRVNLNEECWLGINGVPSTTSALGGNGYNAYANAMGAYVTALNSAGIYAEVDLHLNAPGTEVIEDEGNDDFQNPMPESNSITFWASVASYFASNHAVIFGVFNEPFPVNYNSDGDTTLGWACDLNGCTVNDCTDSTGNCSGTYAGVGMKTLIDTIRLVDKTTPLLVGGPDFAGDTDDWLNTFYPGGVSIDPDNLLAASVHIYFPSGNSPCSVTTNVSGSCPSTDADAITQVAARTPVLVDELADFSCSGNQSTTSSLTPFLQTIDYVDWVTHDDIGWVGWAWTTSGCDPNMITSWTTGAPSPMGTAEYCELNFDGVNNGSLTNCQISDVGNPPTTSVLIPSNRVKGIAPSLTVPSSIPHNCGTDATTLLNTWFAGLPADSTVNLPQGACYLVSNSPTSLLTIERTNKLTIDGNGATFEQKIYDAAGDPQAPVLTLGANISLTINSVTLRGPSSSGGGNVEGDAGILMWQNYAVALGHVTIENVEGDGLDVYPLGNEPGVNWYVEFDHSTIENIGYHAIVPEAVDHFAVEDSTISSGDIDAEVDFSCQGDLANCGTLADLSIGAVNMAFIGDSFPNGMALEDGMSCLPVGNWVIENNNFGSGGLDAQFDTTYSLSLSALEACGRQSQLTITGNTSSQTNLTPCCGSGSPYIVLQGWSDVTIANNHFVYALSNALVGGPIVDLWGDTDVTIEDNALSNWYNITAENAPSGWPPVSALTLCGNTYGPDLSLKEAACPA